MTPQRRYTSHTYFICTIRHLEISTDIQFTKTRFDAILWALQESVSFNPMSNGFSLPDGHSAIRSVFDRALQTAATRRTIRVFASGAYEVANFIARTNCIEPIATD